MDSYDRLAGLIEEAKASDTGSAEFSFGGVLVTVEFNGGIPFYHVGDVEATASAVLAALDTLPTAAGV